MRTTRKEVEGVFRLWVSAVNGHVASSYSDVGCYRLNHNSVYGGYEIQKVSNAQGGVSVVSGVRQSAYAFVTALRMGMVSISQLAINRTLNEVA